MVEYDKQEKKCDRKECDKLVPKHNFYCGRTCYNLANGRKEDAAIYKGGTE